MSEKTEIEIALENNDLSKIKEFIQTGGNVYKNFESSRCYIRETLLSRACRQNKAEIVEIILDVYERDYEIAEKFVSHEKEKDFLLKYIFIAWKKNEIKEVIDLNSMKSQNSSRKFLVFFADRKECVLVPIVEDKSLMFKLYKNGFLSINCRAETGENPGSLVGAMGQLDLLKKMVAIGLNFKGLFPGMTESYDHYFIEKIVNYSDSIELIKYCLLELKLDNEDLLKFTEKNQSIDVFEFILEYLCSKAGSSKADYIQAYCKNNNHFIMNCKHNLSYELVAHIYTMYNVEFIKISSKFNFLRWFFKEPKSTDYIAKILEIERDNMDNILDLIQRETNSTVVAAIWEALDKNTLKKINKNNVKIIIKSQTEEYFHLVDPFAIYDEENEETALFIALELNCEPLIKILISKGANLLRTNKEGHTTLTAACKYSTPAIIDFLIKKVPSLMNKVGATGYYPLTELIYRDDSFINVFKQMLKSGANFHILGDENYTLLHHSVFCQKMEFVKMCLDLGINPSLQACNGNTALHVSACKESLEIFDFILSTGKVDIETKNNQGDTILHKVCESFHPNFFSTFIEKTKPNINALNNAGQTPMYLCFNNESFKKLLEMGADTSIIGKNNLPFYTFLAESEWKTDILHEILSNPDIDLTITADKGTTLLHLLPQMDLSLDEYFKNQNFRELFRKCTNTCLKNYSSTAFQSAAKSSKILKYMFEYAKPDLEHKNDLGETALFENLRFAFNKDVLELLIEKGANVNAQNNQGNSLIFESVYSEGTEMLLKAGASTQILNYKGQSALHCAAKKNDLEIALLLLKYGADLELKDGDNKKPSDLCTSGYVKDFLNYILG